MITVQSEAPKAQDKLDAAIEYMADRHIMLVEDGKDTTFDQDIQIIQARILRDIAASLYALSNRTD